MNRGTNKKNRIGRTGAVIVVATLLMFVLTSVFLVGCGPKQSDEAFEKMYKDLLKADGQQDEKPVVTPGEETITIGEPTPSPTAAPTQAAVPKPPADATIDLQATFSQNAYPSAARSARGFGSGAEFFDALKGAQWVFSETTGNPNAVVFNGGYLDMGEVDTSIYLPAYEFFESEAYYIELDPASYMSTYEQADPYYTQEIGGVWYACIEVGYRVTYADIGFKVLVTMFITDSGELVERMSLYDAHTDTLFHISYDNVYVPGTAPGDPPVQNDGHMPMQWATAADFETALRTSMWTSIGAEMTTVDIIIPGYEDISLPTIDMLVFEYNDILYVTETDAQSGEISGEYEIVYGLSTDHAYAYLSDYEIEGETYEVDQHFYIDENGLLIETVRLFDHTISEYFVASNMNIYAPYEP